MTLEERINERVIEEVARIFKKGRSEINRDTRFAEDLKIKSLNLVELIAILENEFGVMIPFGEARRRKTVGEAIDLIVSLRRR